MDNKRQGNRDEGTGGQVPVVPNTIESQVMKGIITRLLPGKGYGFVCGDDQITRFMSCNSVVPKSDFDLMRAGMNVEFVSVDTGDYSKGNGLRAEEVRIVK